MNTTTTLQDKFRETYNISDVISSFNGGQKAVYIVDLNTGERVVIKIFHNFGDRERREIALYERFQEHAGVPNIVSISEYDGNTVLTEEFIDGSTLEQLSGSGDYRGNAEAISSLIAKIIDVLNPIWESGLIHRDLKPENIIVTPQGDPVIIDFGIAKDPSDATITETGFQPNSWRFAAPEQLFAKKDLISYRTDFFSLGVIAFLLYHGSMPFGTTREEVRDVLSQSDYALSCECLGGCGLVDFCSSACRVNPSERPRNAEMLLKLLP